MRAHADADNRDLRNLILVTDASGYIGGRLVPQLVAKGYPVRCLARDPRKVSGRGWGNEVEVIAGDVLDRESEWTTWVG